MRPHFAKRLLNHMLLLCLLLSFAGKVSAQSKEVLGEVELTGATKVEKTSGVWVDGQYLVDGQFVGHVGEFGGVGKSLLIAPGH